MPWPDPGTRMVVATRPLALGELSPGERAAYDRLGGELRRRDWLLGRAALKRLLHGADTSGVTFPNRRLSLSHAGGVAVAVRVVGGYAGVGVDFERRRTTDPRTARFFLHQDERVPDHDLLRLWTVKEALFKATPDNEGAQLLDYRVDDPAAAAGSATDGRGHAFEYASSLLCDGSLSVAICVGSVDVPV